MSAESKVGFFEKNKEISNALFPGGLYGYVYKYLYPPYS